MIKNFISFDNILEGLHMLLSKMFYEGGTALIVFFNKYHLPELFRI